MISADVRDWLDANLEGLEQIYNGKFNDTSREKLMSVNQGVTISQQRAMGGMTNTGYSRLACNCILHWNKSVKETEMKAREILTLLLSEDKPIIGGYYVAMINVRNFVTIGSDENDIFEFAIDFEIIYNRSKELEGE